MPNKRENSEIFILSLLTLLAALMVGYLVAEKVHMNADSLYYLVPVDNWVHGDGLTFNGTPETLFPPGYGIMAYPFVLVLGNIEMGGAIASALLYVLLVPLSYVITRYLFRNGLAGLLVAFFTMVTPPLLQQAYQPMSDVPFVFFYLLGLGLFARVLIQGNTLPQSIGLGFLVGLLYLIRPEGFMIGVLVVFTLVVIALRQRNRSQILLAVLVGVLFLVCALPYIAYLHEHLGEWTISGKTRVNLIWGTEVRANPEKYADMSPVDFIIDQGWSFIPDRIFVNIKDGLGEFIGMNRHAFSLLGIVGLIFVFTQRHLFPNIPLDTHIQKALFAGALFFSPIFSYTIFFVGFRFFLAYSLPILMVMAFLIVQMLKPLPSRISHGILILGGGLSLILLIYQLVPFYSDAALDNVFREEPFLWNSKVAGQWMDDNIDDLKGVTLLSPGKVNIVSFYANHNQDPINEFDYISNVATLEEIADLLKNVEPSYLVIEKNYRANNPNIWNLWDDPTLGSEHGLELVHAEDRFQIYQLTD